MNIILKIILFNLLLIYSLKYNNKLLCLLIILFSLYMLYTYYYINNIIEGNTTLDEYKMNFVGLLNKDVKTSYKEDILYDRILDNFTKLLKLMDRSEGTIPPNQMCRGELGEWSECSRECGRGQLSRRFNITQEAGVDGIQCIFKDGQVETKECFNRLCKFHEPCVEDHDCLSNYCSKSEKICTYPHMCERDRLQNCNFEQCQELEEKYGDYTYDTNQQRCKNKYIDLTVKELSVSEEISLEEQALKDKMKEEKNKRDAKILNEQKTHLCYIAKNVGTCSDYIQDDINSNYSKTKCNKHKQQDIPCYYDYEGNECKKISEKEEYKNSEKWLNIRKGLNELSDLDDSTTATDFFNCNNLNLSVNSR